MELEVFASLVKSYSWLLLAGFDALLVGVMFASFFEGMLAAENPSWRVFQDRRYLAVSITGSIMFFAYFELGYIVILSSEKISVGRNFLLSFLVFLSGPLMMLCFTLIRGIGYQTGAACRKSFLDIKKAWRDFKDT